MVRFDWLNMEQIDDGKWWSPIEIGQRRGRRQYPKGEAGSSWSGLRSWWTAISRRWSCIERFHDKAVVSGMRTINGIIIRCLCSKTHCDIICLLIRLCGKPNGNQPYQRNGVERVVGSTCGNNKAGSSVVPLYGTVFWMYHVEIVHTGRSVKRISRYSLP